MVQLHICMISPDTMLGLRMMMLVQLLVVWQSDVMIYRAELGTGLH